MFHFWDSGATLSIPGSLLVIAIAGLGAWFLHNRRRRRDDDEPGRARLARPTEHPFLDFHADARELVRERGHASVWDFMRANPGVPMTELANALGGPPAAVLAAHAIQEARERRELQALVCDLVLRHVHYDMRKQLSARKSIFTGEIHEKIPDGEPFEFYIHVTTGLPRPYGIVEAKMCDIFRTAPPARDWKPTRPDDPLLLSVYDQAVATLSAREKSALERGETLPDPGDLFRATMGRYGVHFDDGPRPSRADLAKVPPELGQVLAAHWCQSEVRSGGFEQLFWNWKGALAPEGAAGLAAIGMTRAAELVRKAMSILGASYPRSRWWRTIVLVRARKRVAELGPLGYALIKELKEEAGGFELAADAYVSAHPEWATEPGHHQDREAS